MQNNTQYNPKIGGTSGKETMVSVLPAVAEQLLAEIHRSFQTEGKVSDDLLSGLSFVFGTVALQALDLTDRRNVSHITTPSGRTAYQVVGSSGRTYTCLAPCLTCPCPAFLYSVLKRSETLLCKHLLAVHLSQAMGLCSDVAMSDQELSRMLLNGRD
ncbi:zinc finger SWIM domain-containing protein 7 isoform X1 [Petromyzon marinus]|uniref:Zinc finger SWIM domain-containing protein 7 isoform X1 n=2 Tax=Petromyzon marinus TaxID=7757 RepID=A0AAJ7TT99_PETMA|nr:zinc finger SWIM domain-containing protein 7 isoform X1 [Petromyzon marinus]XP_032823653.1 zinc finger SWIM domain-containing protein 7 isoform X1 [Petromyzon marinus]XP_032823655.1 zinc finger SWIM domain-containing protein 7 isoform X1 [Petromyzon marinus]XP_032823656.1 zinc finger SWIM domain-containing protein 7 isoform X1 [Petromyzon marinus]XP_032823657.1 zinc finger SWIM domain-containing protein 7 isoform X1 [Petromyzon marinus]XP_032823658.1 zinc finger SWIM domain-containing prote